MEIVPGINTVGPCIAIGRTLILGDLHIGAEEALNKQGFMIPRFQFLGMRDELLKLVGNDEYDTVIINGDLKHEFGTISQTEWTNTLKALDTLAKHCPEIVLVRGNHDTLLGPIAQRSAVEVEDYHMLGEVMVCHGSKIPFGPAFEKAKTIIIGHEHPAITLKRNGRVESFKCFLRGSYRGRMLIVMPSFNMLTAGSNVLVERPLSPFLEHGMGDFEVFALGDRVYEFGKVSTLKDL